MLFALVYIYSSDGEVLNIAKNASSIIVVVAVVCAQACVHCYQPQVRRYQCWVTYTQSVQ